MRRVAVFLCWFIAFATSTYGAQMWPSIGTFAMPDGGTATVLVDGGNGLTRHGDFWTARQKTLYSAPQKTSKGASFLSELDIYAHDCSGNRTALVSYARYEGADLEGSVVDKMERSSSGDYEWITPTSGSVLMTAGKVVCSLAAFKSRYSGLVDTTDSTLGARLTPAKDVQIPRRADYYPVEAKRSGYRGTVLLAMLVEVDGSIHDVTVLESSGYDVLDVAAVRNWTDSRFKTPAKLDGEPVRSVYYGRENFTLGPPPR